MLVGLLGIDELMGFSVMLDLLPATRKQVIFVESVCVCVRARACARACKCVSLPVYINCRKQNISEVTCKEIVLMNHQRDTCCWACFEKIMWCYLSLITRNKKILLTQ